MLIEKKPPTHTLVVEVALHVEDPEDLPQINPFKDALDLVLALSRVATLGYLASGEVQVTVREEDDSHNG
jgi:hypothetical protein